jgi:hypothetical protein
MQVDANTKKDQARKYPLVACVSPALATTGEKKARRADATNLVLLRCAAY